MSIERHEKTQRLETVSGEEEVRLLCDLSGMWSHEDPARGLTFARRAQALAKSLGHQELVADAERLEAQSLLLQGNIAESIEIAKRAIDGFIACGSLWGHAKTLTLLGALHRRQGAYHKALEYHQQALEVAIELGDEELISRVHNNLGLVCWNLGRQTLALEHYQRTLMYWESQPGHESERAYILSLNNVGILSNDQHEFEAALAYFERAIELGLRLGESSTLINAYFNAGLSYEGLGQIDRAIVCYQRSYEAAETIDGRDSMGHACKVLAKVQIHREQWSDAEATIRRGLDLFEETGERRQAGQMLSLLSQVLSAQGRDPEALSLLEQGLELAIEIESIEREMEVRTGLAELHAQIGDHERAYEELLRAREIERRVFAQSKAEQIAQLEASHQTARKDLEASLMRERAEALEAEVEARTKELRDKNEQLERARQRVQRAQHAKDSFLAMVGHELRTPLTTIVGFGEMAHESLSELDGVEQARGDLEEVLEAGAKLSRLIEQILELSNATANELELAITQLSLTALLSDALTRHQALAAAQHNDIELEIELTSDTISSDPERLHALLHALLENAHKYTRRGSVTLSARGDEAHVYVTVTDTGVGMEPEALARVFSPFEQHTLTSNRVLEGMGLGLALARHHVALLGGKLEVDSIPGEGTTFCVTLPRSLT